MKFVVDASVALKWGVFEEGSDRARALVAGGHDLVAPDLLTAEVANALWRKVRLGDIARLDWPVALEASSVGIRGWFPVRPLISRAIEIALSFGHPVYDCVYLALAEIEAVPLVTADRRLLTRLGSVRRPFEIVPL